MKKEDKHFKDLCSRLPYGVKVECEQEVCKLSCCSSECVYIEFPDADMIVSREADEVKPYLFPLSSMTIKQKAELAVLVVAVDDMFKSLIAEVDFYNKYHFDYRGLIDKGRAIDATNLGIYE